MIAVEEQLVAAGMSDIGARSRVPMFERAESALRALGVVPGHRIHVPGRIEVLGKHTDYAGGRSLLAAVERGFCVVSAPRTDREVRMTDVGRGDAVTLSLDPHATGARLPHWAIYPAAVLRRLTRDFAPPLQGADIAFVSDLPPASGLSSSSALLIATFEALRFANNLDAREDFHGRLHGVLDLAAYLGSVESGRSFRGFGGEAGVGTSGGSQDHTAILGSQAGKICQFRYSPQPTLEGSVELRSDLVVVVAVSGVVAQKTAGAREAYNRAAALSEALLQAWRTATGRSDATLFEAVTSHPEAVERLKEAVRASPNALFPTEHLVARLDQFFDESAVLIPAAFAALEKGDLQAFGVEVDRSQRGAEEGLRNQVPETIDLARIARALGAHAASAFGAGFGGSVWALVTKNESRRFRADWESEYRRRHHHETALFFETAAGPGLWRADVSSA